MVRYPAEWEPQSATMIAWPEADGDFKNLSEVEASLPHNKNIYFINAQYDDIWLRDTVFLTVEHDQQACLLDFQFNGWGNKYPHQNDNQLNRQLLQHPIFQGLNCRHIDFVLEGGSIESDGQGSLLTTENCLLNPNRNPDYNRYAISRILEKELGCEKVFRLQQECLAGDDTDAHIDTLVRFCGTETIAYSACDNPANPHFEGLKSLRHQLESLTTREGKPYQLIALPLPQPVFDDEGRPLPANYANFLILNHAVLVPVYGDPSDEIALSRLSQCFPDRDIIPVASLPIVHQYGSLHCMSMHFPASLELNL